MGLDIEQITREINGACTANIVTFWGPASEHVESLRCPTNKGNTTKKMDRTLEQS